MHVVYYQGAVYRVGNAWHLDGRPWPIAVVHQGLIPHPRGWLA